MSIVKTNYNRSTVEQRCRTVKHIEMPRMFNFSRVDLRSNQMLKIYRMWSSMPNKFAVHQIGRPARMAHSIRLWLETQLEFRAGRMFVIEAVHLCSAPNFKGMQCTVLSMVLCTIKTLEVIL